MDKNKILNLLQESIFCKQTFDILKDYLQDFGYTLKEQSLSAFAEILHFAKIIINNSTLKEFLEEFFPNQYKFGPYKIVHFVDKDISLSKSDTYNIRANGYYDSLKNLDEIIIFLLYHLQIKNIKKNFFES